MKLCTPASVYFVFGIISILVAFGYGFGVFALLAKLVLVLVWTWFLNYLCTKSFSGLAWFLVVLPFVFLFVTFLMVLDAMNIQK